MTTAGRRDAAAGELALADEELQAAESLLREGLPRVAMARAYFATFHAVRARLYRAGLEPRSHSGVQSLFNAHFVRTGAYEPATSRLLARLQKFREEADYSLAFVIDAAGAREELAAARALVARINEDIQGAPEVEDGT